MRAQHAHADEGHHAQVTPNTNVAARRPFHGTISFINSDDELRAKSGLRP